MFQTCSRPLTCAFPTVPTPLHPEDPKCSPEEISMSIKPWRALNPDGGDHYLIFERRFRYVVEDPEHTWRRVWIPTVVACPICQIDTGLRFAHKLGMDVVVEAACRAGHVWPEPRVDVSQWMAYCRFRAGRQEIDWLWLIEAGFGEEPPPPIDYAEEIRRGAVEIAKYGQRKAKAKVRSKVRKVKNKAKKRIKNEAMRPVAALLRTAWMMQAGGVQPVAPSRRRREAKPPKTPSVAAYRKAYGMQAPKKGPRCLVCQDSGRITAPGISIPCTECKGSVKRTTAAAVVAAAERRAVAFDKRSAERDVAHTEAAKKRAAERQAAAERAAEEQAAEEQAAERQAAAARASERRRAARKQAAEKRAAERRAAEARAAKERAADEQADEERAAAKRAAEEWAAAKRAAKKAKKRAAKSAAKKRAAKVSASRGAAPGRRLTGEEAFAVRDTIEIAALTTRIARETGAAAKATSSQTVSRRLTAEETAAIRDACQSAARIAREAGAEAKAASRARSGGRQDKDDDE
ncbi:hypothetical protein ACFU7X_18265 [Streptomyces chartreusis]|uniref:hypothetical protein n=1 Tax=Streptomyces chartreusis TaxID=1969 RepID=UPI00368FBC27